MIVSPAGKRATPHSAATASSESPANFAKIGCCARIAAIAAVVGGDAAAASPDGTARQASSRLPAARLAQFPPGLPDAPLEAPLLPRLSIGAALLEFAQPVTQVAA